MTDNERILKARGECRHGKGWVIRGDGEPICKVCGKPVFSAPNYDSDPAAWTLELYQWIESEGLVGTFCDELYKRIDVHMPCNSFEFVRATPAQKAQALARAIEERS